VDYPKKRAASVYAPQVNYAQLLFPDFSLIACGWLLCRYTVLNRLVWEPVESLVYYFLFPVLLFHSIVRSPIDFGATSNLLAAGVGIGLSGIALAYALPLLPLIGARIDRREYAASAQIAFRFNSFIVLALTGRIAGPQGLLMVSVLIGVCVPMLNIAAVWPMARHGQSGFARQLARNPMIVATLSGLIVNLLGLGVPAWLEPTLSRIGGSSLALGLMAAGAGMKFASLARAKTLAVSLLAIRHLTLPLIGWGLAVALRLDATQTTVLMIFAAAPTAPTAYVLAARMGYNGPYVAGLVTLSTLLGVASLSLGLSLITP
jgi:predicted permease